MTRSLTNRSRLAPLQQRLLAALRGKASACLPATAARAGRASGRTFRLARACRARLLAGIVSTGMVVRASAALADAERRLQLLARAISQARAGQRERYYQREQGPRRGQDEFSPRGSFGLCCRSPMTVSAITAPRGWAHKNAVLLQA